MRVPNTPTAGPFAEFPAFAPMRPLNCLRRLPHTETKTESSVVGQVGLGGAGKTDEPVIVVAHSRDT